MQLKKNSSDQKLRGGYYTPEVLADFIVKNIEINKEINILEQVVEMVYLSIV